MRLRLASYNIHAGVGSDKRFDPKRLARVLQQLDADIIGLQEVVSVGPEGFALLDELAQACGMEAVAGPTMMRGDASYGNALLSRWPVRNVQRLEQTITRYEPRGALSLEVGEAQTTLNVAVTHLGLRNHERRAQVEKLLEWLPPSPAPIALLGDLNEWFPWSENLRRLRQRFVTMPALRTFPSRFPLLALDRILLTPQITVKRVWRETGSFSRIASDHLPLLADIELRCAERQA